MKQNKTVIIVIAFIIVATCSLFVFNYIVNKKNQTLVDQNNNNNIIEEIDQKECLKGVYIEEYQMCGEEIGQSVEDRSIYTFGVGGGKKVILFVGGIHTGTEKNTCELARKMLEHYNNTSINLPKDISLYFVPMLNPDGIANDTHPNAHGINLNRNWLTDDWKKDVYHPVSGTVVGGGGEEPFSEPEILSLHEYIQELNPDLVVVWHSKANTVEDNDTGIAHDVAAIYAEAAEYIHIDEWTYYETTGTFLTYAKENNIPAFNVELETREIEFERNLKGIEAMFDYFENKQ